MRKLIVLCIILIALISCNSTDIIFSKHVSQVEFWNGGVKIREYNNCLIRKVLSEGQEYYLICDDFTTEKIIISDALTLVYKE